MSILDMAEIGSVVLGLAGLLYYSSLSDKRQKQLVGAVKPYETINKVDDTCSLGGPEKTKGRGILLLTDYGLYFQQHLPKREVYIPLEHIKSCEKVFTKKRSHKGQACIQVNTYQDSPYTFVGQKIEDWIIAIDEKIDAL